MSDGVCWPEALVSVRDHLLQGFVHHLMYSITCATQFRLSHVVACQCCHLLLRSCLCTDTCLVPGFHDGHNVVVG
jgi:hypothetical protein